MAEEKRAIILRNEQSDSSDLILFVDSHIEGEDGEVFLVNLAKQLAWLRLIVNNLESHIRRNG